MENGNMTPLVPRQDGRLEWGNGVVSMLFDIAADSPVRLCNVVGRNMVPIDGRLSDDGKPVVEKVRVRLLRCVPPIPVRKTTD